MKNKEYLELVEELLEHDRLYFVEHSPIISDYAYDKLYRKLLDFEHDNPHLIAKNSPTQSINESTKRLKKRHLAPMLSLANSYNKEDIEKFVKRITDKHGDTKFCIELKLDGASIAVSYNKGKFTHAATRGNGKVGEDVTQAISTIKGIPKQIEYDYSELGEEIEIRGEVFLTKKQFQHINVQRESNNLEPFANARNAAAGSLKLLDREEAKSRGLDLICYSVVGSKGSLSSQSQIHQFLKEAGLPHFDQNHLHSANNATEVMEIADQIESIRPELPFEIDGIVIKVDDLNLQQELGYNAKSPRHSLAHKFSPERAQTLIEDIVVQVGKSGTLTPVAILSPTELAGSVIKRATLHNQEEIDRLDVRIGDYVNIEKGGDVIPKVTEVIVSKRKNSKKWKMEPYCPCCGSKVVKKENEVAIRCINKNCKEQIARKMIFFVSKRALDIEGLGKALIRHLIDERLISEITDIYRIQKDDLLELDGIQEKLATKILSNIEKSKRRALFKWIVGLSIPYIGEGIAQKIAQQCKTLQSCFSLEEESLTELEGVGQSAAQSFVRYFEDKENRRIVEDLISLGVAPKIDSDKTHRYCKKKFAITGTFKNFKREDIKRIITEKGGFISSTVGKIDYLLVGESPGSKLKKAKELEIELLYEEDFIRDIS